MKIRMLILGVMAILPSLALAQTDNRNRVSLEGGSGDADYIIDGTSYDGDIIASAVGATFYVSDRIAFSLARSSGEGTILGVNVEVSGSSYGVGYTFGDIVDFAAGYGSELTVDISNGSTEATAAGVTSTSNYTNVGVTFNRGLGDGVTVGLDFSTDTANVFNDNSFGLNLYKHIGSNIVVGGGFGASKTVEDANNSTTTSSFVFGAGYVF